MADEPEEPEIVGETVTFGQPSGTEAEGTLIGAVHGGWPNLEETEVPAPPSPENPVPVEVAVEAAPIWEEQTDGA